MVLYQYLHGLKSDVNDNLYSFIYILRTSLKKYFVKKVSIKIFDVVSIFENKSDKIKKINDGFVIRYTNRTYSKGPPVK